MSEASTFINYNESDASVAENIVTDTQDMMFGEGHVIVAQAEDIKHGEGHEYHDQMSPSDRTNRGDSDSQWPIHPFF